ncbi:hypothetical protein T09_5068 [Trichinella sp. T9]|nr:hypothetical protein T09_5068 [Trichinella sp. T9]
MGTVRTFFCIFREKRNREPPVYVCCTLLIVFDRLMIIDSILDSKVFLENCKISWAIYIDLVVYVNIREPSHFFRLSREIRNQKPPGYVCCTLLIFSDRLMPKKSIFGEKAFSRKLQNFMGFMALWTWFSSENQRKRFSKFVFFDCYGFILIKDSVL